MLPAMENYYNLLEVDNNAEFEIIKYAYLKKIKQYHPDIYEGDKVFAEHMTRKLNEAYNTLKDKEKRNLYDLEIIKQNKKQKINSNFINKTLSKFNIFSKKIKNFFNFKQNKQSEISVISLKITIIIQFILIIFLFILCVV